MFMMIDALKAIRGKQPESNQIRENKIKIKNIKSNIQFRPNVSQTDFSTATGNKVRNCVSKPKHTFYIGQTVTYLNKLYVFHPSSTVY